MKTTESEKTLSVNAKIKINNSIKGIVFEHKHKKMSEKAQKSTPLHKNEEQMNR